MNESEIEGIPPEWLHQLENGTWVHVGMFDIFGPGANCTLDLCPIEWTAFQYRPILGVNIMFIVLYSLAMLVHIYLGIRWRTWWFTTFMIIGCVTEIVGYIGRIILYYSPWSFEGFMVQIVLITVGPVFFTAAVYVTLSKAIEFFSPEISRLPPKLFYWIFITADVICLCLQATGGALSTISSGSSRTGVDIALAGLALHVFVLVAFGAFFVDYMVRYLRSVKGRAAEAVPRRQRFFFGGLAAAVVLILVRCAYRVDELSEGYVDSTKITHEGLFIALEGVLIVLAVAALFIGHPGFGFKNAVVRKRDSTSGESGLQPETKEAVSEPKGV